MCKRVEQEKESWKGSKTFDNTNLCRTIEIMNESVLILQDFIAMRG